MLKVYNTFSLEKEEFKPLHDNQINMYICGPTVYNYIHIGNARSAIAFDTIRRYFEFRGYDVNFVSNFTDVDDKMIAQAKEDGITVPELADKYIKAFNEDTAPVNIRPATTRTRATDVIPDILEFVQDLVDKGYAYESDGDVYFRAKKYKGYGILAHQDLAELEANASGRLDDGELERKEDPMDFAVWKGEHGDGDIAWESPWGKGRPGWHIECSVMSSKYLGNTIDIHGGGIDLAFPHHTNEIAQSEARTGQKFVNYWMHNGFVNVDNEKMSKSLGNFTTLHDMIQNYDDPMAIRFLLATTQYRRPINYAPDTLAQAKVELDRIRTGYRNLAFRLEDAVSGNDASIDQQVDQAREKFIEAMDDDINTANAIGYVFDLVALANTYASSNAIQIDSAHKLLNEIKTLMDVFGVDGLDEQKQLDKETLQMLDDRVKAREEGNYELSDQLRDELKSRGVTVEDTKNGQRWFSV